MYRFTTHALIGSLCLAVSATAGAQLTTAADYTFDDASALTPFFEVGSPTVVGGELVLDGNSYLEIDDPLLGATDNYVIEAIVTIDNYDDFDPDDGIPVFDFVFARNDPFGDNAGNNGQGFLFQDFGAGEGQVGGLNSFSGMTHSFGPGIDPVLFPTNTPTHIALVQNEGVTSVYVGGRQLLDTTTAAIVGTPINLGIGTHPFDGALGAMNGSIDRVRLSTFNVGEFDPADLILPSFIPAAEDLDLDGDVDDADFGLYFAAFTGPDVDPPFEGRQDLDADGDVDDADFGLAFAAFTGPGAAASVPEPASLALLAMGGAMALRRRR